MKKIQNILIAGSVVFALASCSVSAPLMVSDHAIGNKRGEASRKIILGITLGHTDLGAITAARNGGITKIATVDWKVQGGLFVRTVTTVVTGE